ncbi:MAG: HD domain-containing protein [Lewinellaceae bacterium]|nr:HD domain-containing protein [Lewinellaceae bacterium]MCB9287973.1 HD domain-containing protein [Lewinellaceae bacterium]
MAEKTIVVAAERYVTELLKDKLTEDHRYHSLKHTLKVRDAALELGRMMQLEEDDLEVLGLAALFHDTGFSETYEGHEAVSGQIARAFLESHDYPEEKIRQVRLLIDATYPAKYPSSTLESLIKDADLSNLGSERYFETLKNLRYEWAIFLNQAYDDREWYKMNYKFVKDHEYFTPAAKALYGPQWNVNRKKLKELRNDHSSSGEKTDHKKVEKKSSKLPGGNISASKSAQMMFKTALRNHLDLSNLADNKANIMLSVNALIITIVMPLAASYVRSNLYLLIPMGTLLATCLISMIFATLATRPIKMMGYTSRELIDSGKSNLFFFGNFYKMTFSEYQEGMEQVVADDKNLESSIMRDLYYLGHSLGRKYNQLRICYTIFMYGVIATVIIFGVSYSLFVS